MKSLLITGGTGFLGQNLALELESLFSNVILCSRSISKENVSARLGERCILEPLDITDKERVDFVFKKHKPDYVIHAAGVRNVHFAEKNPIECINTNIGGSENIARASALYGCKRVVAISSLRAASPTEGVYGMSKALMEKIFYGYSKISTTQFVCVRLGNIAWSPDSVLTLWREMAERDGLIKSTGHGMSRYFTTPDQVASFVKDLLFSREEYSCLTVVPIVKLAFMEHLLKLFSAKFGSEYELSTGASYERKSDILIGKSELPFTIKLNIGGKLFYGIANEKQMSALPEETVTIESSQLMSDDEIINMIGNSK